MNRMNQGRNVPPSRPTRLAEKREIAQEFVRERRKNVGAPPIVRSKRNRSANQEDRSEDAGGRHRRAPKRG
jgi:hypothetical protein